MKARLSDLVDVQLLYALETILLSGLGASYINLGEHKGIENYEKAIEVYKKFLDQEFLDQEFLDSSIANYLDRDELNRLRIVATGGIGTSSLYLSKYDDAIEFYNETIKLAIESNEKFFVAEGWRGLGHTYRELGQYEKALQGYEKYLEIYEASSGYSELKLSQGPVLMNMGSIYREIGDFERAISFHQRALAASKEEGKESLGENYLSLANAVASSCIRNRTQKCEEASFYEEVFSYYMKAYESFEKDGDTG